ncbi:MAG: efflux transporter outer membrane subunit [Janthinobacterium lividum]
MKTSLALRATLLSAALAGCSLAPHYERPAPPVAANFTGGEANVPGSAQTTATADIGWRDFLGDPQLQRLVELALQNNRDLRVAVINVEAAAAQYRIQRAALLPTLDLGASGTRARTPASLSVTGRPEVGGDYSVGPSASWEIDLFGRVKSLSDAALATYFATAEARRAAEISLVSGVAQQYLTLRADDEQLDITRETLKTSGESYRIAKLQFDNGVGSELDLREAETVVEQAQSNLAAQLRARAQAVNYLTLLVGEPLPTNLPPALSLDDQRTLADIPAGLPSELLTRRPDILQAEDQLKAYNADIGAARAAFFPSISLTGDFGTASSMLSGLFKAGSAAWSFGPSISLPIFRGGENIANLKLAEAQKQIAVAQYEKAIQTAFREVSDSLAGRSTYDEQITSLEEYVHAQQRRLDLSTLRYKSGVDSYLSVLTAQTDLYSAQQILINTRLSRLTNLVGLYQQLGGGWIARTGDAPRPGDAPGAAADGTSGVAPGTASVPAFQPQPADSAPVVVPETVPAAASGAAAS